MNEQNNDKNLEAWFSVVEECLLPDIDKRAEKLKPYSELIFKERLTEDPTSNGKIKKIEQFFLMNAMLHVGLAPSWNRRKEHLLITLPQVNQLTETFLKNLLEIRKIFSQKPQTANKISICDKIEEAILTAAQNYGFLTFGGH